MRPFGEGAAPPKSTAAGGTEDRRRPIRASALLFAAALAATLWLGAARRAVWREQLQLDGITGDAGQYYLIAAHLEHDRLYSIDGKGPSWTRLPGMPLLLYAATSPARSYFLKDDWRAQQRENFAWLRAAARLNTTVDLLCAPAILLLGLALGARRFALLGALAWAIQPWSTVIAIHPLSDTLATLLTSLALAAAAYGVGRRARWPFAVAGAAWGLAQLTRADALLLALPIAVAAIAAPGLGARSLLDRALVRPRLVRLGCAVLGFVICFGGWPLRNLRTFGRPHPLGALMVDDDGHPTFRDEVTAWLRTFPGDERTTQWIAWRFPTRPVLIAMLPPEAFDDPRQELRTRALLADYNHAGALDPSLRARFATLADERCRAHRLACWVGLPLRRVARTLLPPHDGYGMSTLPTLLAHRARWTFGEGALLLGGLVALVVAAARRRAAAAALLLWLVARCALVSRLQEEPRYLLEALPLLYAAATIAVAAAARFRWPGTGNGNGTAS